MPPIQIDIDKVVKSKLGSRARFIPSFLLSWLKNTIRQDELNRLLRLFHPLRGADFCEAALKELNVNVSINNPSQLPSQEQKKVIFACNHPLGGFDGVALIAEFTRRYGPGVKFIVNDLLMNVEPLNEVFLPINKHGKQNREATQAIKEAMDGPDPIVVFPAGLVSRQGKDDSICDLEWHKMFVTKAIQHQRDVIPVRFFGRNSDHFYKVARWRKRLGIKFNIEMLYLPAEALDTKGKSFTITIGERIPYLKLKEWGTPLQCAQTVKNLVYSLNP